MSHKSNRLAFKKATKESNPENLDKLNEANDVRSNLGLIGKKLPEIELQKRWNSRSTASYCNIASIAKRATTKEVDSTTLMAKEKMESYTSNNIVDVPITQKTNNKLLLQDPMDTYNGCNIMTVQTRCQHKQALRLLNKKNWLCIPPYPKLKGPNLCFTQKEPNHLECSSCSSIVLDCAATCPVPYGWFLNMDFASNIGLLHQECTHT